MFPSEQPVFLNCHVFCSPILWDFGWSRVALARAAKIWQMEQLDLGIDSFWTWHDPRLGFFIQILTICDSKGAKLDIFLQQQTQQLAPA